MEFMLLSIAILAGNEPASLVKTLFHAEIQYVEGYGDGPFGAEGLARLYTADFTAALEAVLDLELQRNQRLIDGDPIIGQESDCWLRDLEIVAGEAAETTAEVTARFMSQWCMAEATIEWRRQVTEIVFHLVNVDGEWRIDDFEHSLYGSFRGYLDTVLAR